MTTITVSRQLGSLGVEIATEVAARLGYRLVRREVLNQAARRAGAPEAALADIDELGLLGMSPSPRASKAYHQAISQVMLELVSEGNVVIIGRAGQVILRDLPNILHVRVIAPLALRVERLTARYGISPAAAAAQIEASDHYRRNYLKRFYHVRWEDPELYDLVVNTAQLDCASAAEIVVAAVPHQSGRPASPPPQHEHTASAI
ncbi:MAG: cytidylate kinase-like family protein [Anaerolineae bacterium]